MLLRLTWVWVTAVRWDGMLKDAQWSWCAGVPAAALHALHSVWPWSSSGPIPGAWAMCSHCKSPAKVVFADPELSASIPGCHRYLKAGDPRAFVCSGDGLWWICHQLGDMGACVAPCVLLGNGDAAGTARFLALQPGRAWPWARWGQVGAADLDAAPSHCEQLIPWDLCPVPPPPPFP